MYVLLANSSGLKQTDRVAFSKKDKRKKITREIFISDNEMRTCENKNRRQYVFELSTYIVIPGPLPYYT